MKPLKEFTIIKLTVDLNEYNLKRGAVGVILEIYESPHLAYEVEFSDDQGKTIAQVVLDQQKIEIIS